MDLNLTETEKQVRGELRAWLKDNLSEIPPKADSEGDMQYWNDLRGWQKQLFDGGWAIQADPFHLDRPPLFRHAHIPKEQPPAEFKETWPSHNAFRKLPEEMKGLKDLTDLYRLDDTWDPTQKAVCETVRRFVDKEIIPRMAEYQERGGFPDEIRTGIAKLGILEALVSGDLDPITYGLVMRELERAGSTIRSVVSVQGGLVIFPIMEFGSDEQKQQWLEPLGRLEKIGCFGLTEADFGSNPNGMRTRAEKVAGEYRITGSKCWITNGTRADVAIIWAKLEGRICGFLVETDRPGFEARAIRGKWSFRSSDTAELFLDGVTVPESSLLPGARSLSKALACLNTARYGIAWGVIGAARACFEEVINHLANRPQFDGKPLTSHQLIQNKLAWMATELTGMELIAKRLGELKQSGQLRPHQVSLAKMNNCRKALEIARTCRELLGASGIHNEYHTGRHMVDLETVITYEGTEHIHSLVLGEMLTGIKAFSSSSSTSD